MKLCLVVQTVSGTTCNESDWVMINGGETFVADTASCMRLHPDNDSMQRNCLLSKYSDQLVPLSESCEDCTSSFLQTNEGPDRLVECALMTPSTDCPMILSNLSAAFILICSPPGMRTPTLAPSFALSSTTLLTLCIVIFLGG